MFYGFTVMIDICSFDNTTDQAYFKVSINKVYGFFGSE